MRFRLVLWKPVPDHADAWYIVDIFEAPTARLAYWLGSLRLRREPGLRPTLERLS